MKKIYYLFFVTILSFFTTSVTSQQMKIVRCTTPSIIINGKKCVKGDIFDKNSKISWVSAKQVFIAKDEKGHLVRFAATEDENYCFSLSKMINKKHQRMSTRDFDETGIDGTYILDNELTLPTPLDPNKKYIVKVTSTVRERKIAYKAKLSKKNATMQIKSNIFDGNFNDTIKAEIYAYEKESNRSVCLSRNIQFVSIERALLPNE